MTALRAEIARRIAQDGPITVADYMELCLFHPRHGYYTTREPFGASGDFVTAPEISQMFGELLGLWAADSWMRLGSPPAFVLAELGPGRGTMMADMLRATRVVPGFHAAARIHLVEASPRLRERQAAALTGHRVDWAGAFEDLPDGPLILLANEFVDALPIRQFVRTPQGIAERMVGLDAEGALAFGLRPGARLDQWAQARLRAASPGALLEICPAGLTLAERLGARLATGGGAALFIDYGYAGGFGDTLQALRAHASDDVLAHPGEADITAHVDFSALARAATGMGARAFGPIGQGALLARLGIEARAARLMRDADEPTRATIEAARRRLTATGDTEMGTLFKALALVHPALGVVAGFAPGEAFGELPHEG
ncbi:NADH dehydrogenase [ubiquinone] 1 alpha subcomplex assembly factor 7 [Angulomicrobium tetraedrale]|uniref:NADH dehydrogenase [ubiquinone] 1 alpha subcomplex assembly factor 7 n=1 Tax=Ancylobacter tetraedralis TaxID=217068 RepID=A0A839ZAS8_9HYPH|nr:SAM-dependent methyltransferase [Ancylobacter tetraedralis]MBB3771870.1 NADH dehydrogenase [ubiquinone] 1 alpha subcomplex assembly factor 7 [Ancylobacter tetraedralis]